MITEFQRFDDKIVAFDDKKGLITYNYQDNIEEILKQKNVIEEIENTLNKLNNKKNYIDENKDNFLLMLFMENYGLKALAFFFCSCLLIPLALVVSLGWLEFFLRVIGLLLIITTLPSLVYQYKKYKNDMKLNLFNIDEEIKKFEKKLKNEVSLLKTLTNNKTNNKKTDSMKHIIDNSKNNNLLEIQKEKYLYETYRKWCYKFSKNKEDKLLKNNEISAEDLKIMKEMSNRAKVLSKKK